MPRRLGQHFLTRRSTLAEISRVACAYPESPLVEIGPGKGALTEYLLGCSSRLISIELDQVLVHYLTEKFRSQTHFSVIHSDVLRMDLSQWGPVSVVGNLPYYITSPIVEKVLRIGPSLLNAVFLVQLEVAERMAAVPGTRDYGYFSVLVQTFAEPAILERVPPGAFSPPPKVDSAVIQLKLRPAPLISDPETFLRFASTAFRFKRKKLRNNLAGVFDQRAVDAQPEAGMRAEQLSPEQLAAVHQRILEFS